MRGISSLEILHAIEQTMIKLTGDASTKPCDYFDMIAGTSTGGYVTNYNPIASSLNLMQK